MTLKVIKLVTGEELLAEMKVMDEAPAFQLTNITQLRMIPTMTGQAQIALLPYPLASSDKDMIIAEQHVVYCVNPNEDFVEQYRQAFSDIVTPPKQGIII